MSGIVAVVNGGTGSDNVEGALINLGAEDILNKSVDVLLDATSDKKYPSVKAVKTYIDSYTVSSLKEKVIDYNAINGQVQFNTLIPVLNSENIIVYRNGVRISVIIISPNTIQLESGVICYDGDEIKIVQHY